MILTAFLRALSQGTDARFARVLGSGVALTLGLLLAVWVATIELVRWLTPDSLTLPWIGEVGGLDLAASAGSVVLLLVASVFLMVPVASAFTGLLLDRIADAVEVRYYPALPAQRRQPLGEVLGGSLLFLALVVGANLAALLVWPFTGPLAPLLFWAMNGWLLGREYFTLVAVRHMPPEAARGLYRAHRGTVWLAGVLMAAPLSVPLVNLLVPVLGVAAFTHIFHMLRK